MPDAENDGRAQEPAGDGPSGARNDWETFADLVGGSAEIAERGAALADAIRADWESLAATDAPWTTDTIMNEVVNSWEHWTPLMGDAIQQSIDLTVWWMRSFWPTAADDLDTWRAAVDASGPDDATAASLDRGARAVRRMLADDYTSADAVDDWAAAFGAAAKQAWRQAGRARRDERADTTESAAETAGGESDGGAPPP